MIGKLLHYIQRTHQERMKLLISKWKKRKKEKISKLLHQHNPQSIQKMHKLVNSRMKTPPIKLNIMIKILVKLPYKLIKLPKIKPKSNREKKRKNRKRDNRTRQNRKESRKNSKNWRTKRDKKNKIVFRSKSKKKNCE